MNPLKVIMARYQWRRYPFLSRFYQMSVYSPQAKSFVGETPPLSSKVFHPNTKQLTPIEH